MNLRLYKLDPEMHYPPHVLVTDEPDSLRLDIDLSAGGDLRWAFRERPHAAVAYVISSTYRERGGLRAAFYPLIAFPELPPVDTLLRVLNCCKWSERLLDGDWEAEESHYRVFGCRLTERYLLEFVYGVYRTGGFVIPGHFGESARQDGVPPFHVDLAEGRELGLGPDRVAEIRRHYGRSLSAAIEEMTPRDRAIWGLTDRLRGGAS